MSTGNLRAVVVFFVVQVCLLVVMAASSTAQGRAGAGTACGGGVGAVVLPLPPGLLPGRRRRALIPDLSVSPRPPRRTICSLMLPSNDISGYFRNKVGEDDLCRTYMFFYVKEDKNAGMKWRKFQHVLRMTTPKYVYAKSNFTIFE
uniref:Uncharacterized protein n=1 Tax=Oryza brachyantha TaxID=4533 RepID=J3L4X3_ORYBR